MSHEKVGPKELAQRELAKSKRHHLNSLSPHRMTPEKHADLVERTAKAMEPKPPRAKKKKAGFRK